jgi:hypothetical protein
VRAELPVNGWPSSNADNAFRSGPIDAAPYRIVTRPARAPFFGLARHLVAIRLERYRLGDSELSATYDDVGEVLAGLA